MTLQSLLADEGLRRREFPVTAHGVFLSHAAVAPLPRVGVEALKEYARRSGEETQDGEWAWAHATHARELSARLLGCNAHEIALLGPTSLGLSLVALGMPWNDGDEVVYYADDYPANVYPWTGLPGAEVKAVPVRPEAHGAITWEAVEAVLTPRTRMVALASCNFVSGYRLDVDTIGRTLHDRGILFCLDAIQTLGAFPLSVEHVDFLSADSHKWLLGPAGAGIVYVAERHHELLRPALLGSWNVVSPEFAAQAEIRFYKGARRYEPGMLNLPGIAAMAASMDLLLGLGIDNVAERILALRAYLLDRVRPLGYRLFIEDWDTRPGASGAERSGIVTVTHPKRDIEALASKLGEKGVHLSLRRTRDGRPLLRFSPHAYNTEVELDRVAELLR